VLLCHVGMFKGKGQALISALRCSVSTPVQDGYSPLFIASQKGHLATVNALFEGHANVEAKSNVSFAQVIIHLGHMYILS
jgi:ankyrin repeat protein